MEVGYEETLEKIRYAFEKAGYGELFIRYRLAILMKISTYPWYAERIVEDVDLILELFKKQNRHSFSFSDFDLLVMPF